MAVVRPYQWPDLVTDFASEQPYDEGGMFGCPYPYRVTFQGTAEWNGDSWSQNTWTSKLPSIAHFHIYDRNDYQEFFTWDDRC